MRGAYGLVATGSHGLPPTRYGLTCGFRVIRRKALAAVRLSSRRFDIDTEMLLAAVRQGWGVASVPIRAIDNGQASRIRPVPDGLRFLGVVVRYGIAPPRKNPAPAA